MRIGIILPNLAGGGAERIALRLASGLLERGHSIDLLLLRPSGSYRKAVPLKARIFYTAYPFRRVPGARIFLNDATRRGLTLERIPVSPWKRYHALKKLRRRWVEGGITSRNALDAMAVAKYFCRSQPDVSIAILHPANVAAVCGKALTTEKTSVVVTLQSNLSLDYPGDDLARAHILYKEADAVIAVSKGVADGAVRTLDLDPQRIAVIPNPIPVTEIATAASEPVEHPWFAEGQAPVVLTVGPPAPAKDHPTLIRAFALLRHSTEARLAILCDSTGFEAQSGIQETRALAASLGIAEHVVHLDFDENPFRYMARANIVAMSSRWEGFCNVLPEAMACGTAVVSTDAPYGPADILEGGRWGPLVPVGDADALAEALASILAGQRVPAEDLRARAAAFSTEKAVGAYEELLTALLR